MSLKKKTIYKVSLFFLEENCGEPYLNWVGGIEKEYAFCEDKQEAEKIRDLLSSKTTQELRELKILKNDEEKKAVKLSSYTMNNSESIISKLTNQ